MARRDAVLTAVALAISSGVITLYVGPTYLRPLPLWGQVVLAVACGLIVATIAIYSRRRSRRKTSSP